MKSVFLPTVTLALALATNLTASPVTIGGNMTEFRYQLTDLIEVFYGLPSENYSYVTFGTDRRQPLSPTGVETGNAPTLSFGREVWALNRDVYGMTDDEFYEYARYLAEEQGVPLETYLEYWGYHGELPNQLSIEGKVYDSSELSYDETIVVGYLTFQNGIWWNDSFAADPEVTLTMASSSDDADFDGFSFAEDVFIETTPNDNEDPYLDADFVYFIDHPELGSFRVLEGYSATIEILGKFGSLELVGFGDVLTPDTGYWYPGTDPFDPDATIPAPSAMLLLGSGVSCLAAIRRRFGKV